MSITTEKATLQVSFPQEKLEALKFYMNEKDTTIEKELQGHMKSIYEKYVPAPTRRYLDRNDSAKEVLKDVEVSSEEPQTKNASTHGKKRNTKVQSKEVNSNTQAENASNQEENHDQIEEESQGMSMSM